MHPLLIIGLVILAIWIFSFAKSLLEFRNAPLVAPLDRSVAAGVQPLVTVIVPARNEEWRLEKNLESIAAQDYGNFKVLVVDDRSEDRTGELARAFAARDSRFSVIAGEEPRSGWCGKPYAIHQALPQVDEATRYLLLLDADTQIAPQAISRTVETAENRQLGMLSLMPRILCHSFWEKLLQPAIGALITLAYPASRVNNPQRPDFAFANGQFILTSYEVYKSVGGHQRVRRCVLEDVALARIIKEGGHPIMLAHGNRLLATRMYSCLSEIIEGWTKNIYLIFHSRLGTAIGYGLLGIILSFLPLALALISIISFMLPVGSWDLAHGIAGLLVYGTVLAIQMASRRIAMVSPWYAFLAPLGALFTAYIVFRSAYRAIFKKNVTWKGRSYLVSNDLLTESKELGKFKEH